MAFQGFEPQSQYRREAPTLAAFVRHQRTHFRATPTSAPVPLSRTKLAAAADLSQGYIIKIEQGLALKPSDLALTKLAAALNLNDAERAHLFALARPETTAPVDSEQVSTVGKISRQEREYVDALSPHLAAFVDASWNVLHANDAYYGAFPGLESAGNVLVWFFKVEDSKKVMVEWEAEARLTVSWFRSLMASHPDDAANESVFNICATSDAFMRMWHEEDVIADRHRSEKVLRDLATNQIYVVQTRLWRPPMQSDRHTFYLASRN